MTRFLKLFKKGSSSDQETRELVALLENDKNIKVIGRGTVVRNLDSEEHRKIFNKTAGELASRFALG